MLIFVYKYSFFLIVVHYLYHRAPGTVQHPASHHRDGDEGDGGDHPADDCSKRVVVVVAVGRGFVLCQSEHQQHLNNLGAVINVLKITTGEM